ncbi:MAG: HIT family protein [Actinobacteria bacterium]|nr:HIT family protein [Actinomycetota bacterium]
MSSVFSLIIDGSIPGNFAWADEVCVAFATIEPITPGHMLVVPRVEVDQFTAAEDDVLAHLIVVSKRVGLAQQRAFGAPRAALIIAGFEVPHTHLHVLPAWSEEALTFANARRVPGEEVTANAEAVRAALRDLGHGDHVPASVSSPDLG